MNESRVERSLEQKRPAYRLYRLAWAGLDLVYPPHCSGCAKPGSRWCVECQTSMQRVLPPFCDRCGRGLDHPGLCEPCRQALPPYTALRSVGIFEGVLREAMHKLKYAGDMALGEALAYHLVEAHQSLDWQIDLVVPVPLSRARRSERGYNQAALLAWPLALCSGLEYRAKALKKVRDSRSQVGLGFDERRLNIAGAFQADPILVRGKSVLVVDDVTTSGATIEACAQALLDAGSNQVFGLTLARAPFAHSDSL